LGKAWSLSGVRLGLYLG